MNHDSYGGYNSIMTEATQLSEKAKLAPVLTIASEHFAVFHAAVIFHTRNGEWSQNSFITRSNSQYNGDQLQPVQQHINMGINIYHQVDQ